MENIEFFGYFLSFSQFDYFSLLGWLKCKRIRDKEIQFVLWVHARPDILEHIHRIDVGDNSSDGSAWNCDIIMFLYSRHHKTVKDFIVNILCTQNTLMCQLILEHDSFTLAEYLVLLNLPPLCKIYKGIKWCDNKYDRIFIWHKQVLYGAIFTFDPRYSMYADTKSLCDLCPSELSKVLQVVSCTLSSHIYITLVSIIVSVNISNLYV